MNRCVVSLVMLLCWGVVPADACAGEVVKDLAYGPHSSQKFDWYKPAQATGATPLVVFIHGAHGILDKNSLVTQKNSAPLLDLLLQNGITVIAIDDHPFPQFIYPVQVDDAALAIQYFRDQAATLGIAADSVVLWGWSSGSTVAAMVAYGEDRQDLAGGAVAQQSSRPQLYLNWRGQTNWLLMDPSYPGTGFGKPTLGQVDPLLLQQASGAFAIGDVVRSFTPAVLSYFSTQESPPPLLNPHDATFMKDLHARLAAGFPVVAAASVMLQNPVWPTVLIDDLVVQVEWLRARFGLSNDVVDVGQGVAGTLGKPTLAAGGSFAAGGAWQLHCQAAQTAPTPLFFIVGAQPIYAKLLGGTLVPSPDLMVVLPTDGNGTLTLSGQIPPALASLVSYVQFWHADPAGTAGYAASNALKLRVGS